MASSLGSIVQRDQRAARSAARPDFSMSNWSCRPCAFLSALDFTAVVRPHDNERRSLHEHRYDESGLPKLAGPPAAYRGRAAHSGASTRSVSPAASTFRVASMLRKKARVG